MTIRAPEQNMTSYDRCFDELVASTPLDAEAEAALDAELAEIRRQIEQDRAAYAGNPKPYRPPADPSAASPAPALASARKPKATPLPRATYDQKDFGWDTNPGMPIPAFRDKVPAGNVTLAPMLLQGPLFAATKPSHTLERPRLRKELPVGFECGRRTCEYIGVQLTQHHESVLFEVAQMYAGRNPESRTQVSPRALARRTWANTGSQYNSDVVDIILSDLETCRIVYPTLVWNEEIRHYEFRDVFAAVIQDLKQIRKKDDVGGRLWEFNLAPEALALFCGAQTSLDLAIRKKLPDGLTTWLYGWVRSNPNKQPHSLAYVQRLSGYGEDRCPANFTRDLKNAADRLKKLGVVADHRIGNGKMCLFTRRTNSG